MSVYLLYNDKQLLDSLRSGDKDAYTEIYQRYWPILFRHARKLLKNEKDAKDVVQETFISLWTIAADLDQKALLSPYLYMTVRNKILNIFRHNKVVNSHLTSLDDFMSSGTNITDHLVREKLLIKLIEEEIANLPPRMREVFELKRKSNLSYKEIAEIMDISDLTVKTQMSKAIKILREKFGEQLNSFMPFL